MRAVDDVLFEAEYLRITNSDLRDLMGLIEEAASILVEVPVALLAAVTNPSPAASIERASTCASIAMQKLKDIQEISIKIGDLVGGRINVLSDELGGERQEDPS